MGDSVSGIFKTMGDIAQSSKHGGGIGITCSNIRSRGSIIRGTNNRSDGIMPMIKVINEISRYINQGQRKGSIACFYEPWGADIEIFLEMKKNTGDNNLRAKDLFYGLWVPDLFMKCVEKDEDWYLMCPDECKGLVEAYDKKFEDLYLGYVEKGMYKKKIKARELWNSILISQIETGLPYICYKDSVNLKSNQDNIGTITSTNLCCEIMINHDENEYGVCNISTICLGNCVKNGGFDFDLLGKLTRIAVVNLNKIIDINYYPVIETETSNMRNRPIAIGVQGLYDAFIKLRMPFTSAEAKALNKTIFECIQYNAIKQSCELAKKDGPYSTFEGSPSSKGIFQHNMWGFDETKLTYDWGSLRKDVIANGLRNSMLTALPPTASTANIMGNASSFETVTTNIFTRTIIAGNFMIVNKYLMKDLEDLGLWTSAIKDEIILANGSVQNIPEIPQNLKDLYKTTWETSQKETINMSADRSPFIDHSQSLNIFMAVPTTAKLSSMHFHGWKRGLKTGSYYIRSLPSSSAEKISVPSKKKDEQEALSCSIDNKEGCVMCEG
jgi:ribonucleoside-diphosphate reductase alpha subunit